MIRHLHPTIKYKVLTGTPCADCEKEFDNEHDYKICDSCGSIEHQDNVGWCGDSVYCEACFDEDYFYCEDCGEGEHNEYGTHIDGHGTVCNHCFEECYSSCEQCSSNFHEDFLRHINNTQEYVCENCFGDTAFNCSECSLNFTTDQASSTDDTLCKECNTGSRHGLLHPCMNRRRMKTK